MISALWNECLYQFEEYPILALASILQIGLLVYYQIGKKHAFWSESSTYKYYLLQLLITFNPLPTYSCGEACDPSLQFDQPVWSIFANITRN